MSVKLPASFALYSMVIHITLLAVTEYMQRNKVIALFACAISVSTAVGGNESRQFDAQQLVGTWNCTHTMEEADTGMKVDYVINYKSDGQASGSGTLKLKLANFPEIQYGVSNRSSWEVKGNSLILSATLLKVVNQSHPELDSFLNIKSMIPHRLRESSTILELTRSNLVARSDSYGGVYSCSKRVSDS
ncbi:hypothetical protein [Amphritea pacifica]|uniref:hypothetical protein n=1 Tax=Amphritea pacifica TaxID=2811233 RepID=UPI0019638C71|nr:hypothetical protein [Amphritea pacifica]MBN1005413.1 hypothetical protein [Amphritea pacifica]